MYASTQKRDRVSQLCKTDLAEACKLSETIDDEWFRIQAYASIIEVCPANEIKIFLDRIEKDALSVQDAFKVGAVAWAMAACMRRSHEKGVSKLAQIALSRAAEISPPSSRVEALFHVWQAQFPNESKTGSMLLDALVAACIESSQWRGQRTLRDVVLMLAQDDPKIAKRILAAMPDGNYKRQAEKGIAAGKVLRPHPF